MSIRTKILLGYGAFIVPFVAVIAMFWGLIDETKQEVHVVQNETLPFMKVLEKVRVAGLRLATEASSYGTLSIIDRQMSSAPTAHVLREAEKKEMAGERAALAAAAQELEPFLAEVGGGAEDYRDQLRTGISSLDAISRHIEEAVERRDSYDRLIDVIETLNGVETQFVATTTAAVAAEHAEQIEASGELAGTLSLSGSIATTIGVLGTLAAIGGGLFIAGRIAAPIRRLSEQARLVGQGDFDALDRTATGGEVGMLSGAIGKMVDDLRGMIDKVGRQEKLSALGQLAGTVGHDLRNPLAAIGTSLHVLRQTSQSKGFGIERSLDRIGRSVDRCSAIVSDLLDFTRVRELNREPTALDQWLGELLDEHKLAGGVALRREFAGVEALIDRDRFRRVVINLVDNAAQAMTIQDWTAPDGRELTVTVRVEAAGPHVRVAVADNGPGIKSESLAKIFEPLFTTKSSGVGLGLPIVRQIVEQHGGTIDVESQVDVGTTFTIFLPRRQSGQQPAPAAASAAA
jgi:signal transduction histidine kinase